MHISAKYLLTALTIVLMVAFPLMGGTKILHTIPVVEALAIVLLVLLFVFQPRFNFLSKPSWGFIFLIAITPLLYLIPISASIWDQLPGHEVYTQIAQWVSTNQGGDHVNRAFSLIPYRTEHALFALLPPLAIFITVSALPAPQKRFIVYALLAIAVAEASLATIQYSSNKEFFYFGIPIIKKGIALGTYPNPDHFVLLMEISIPLTFALLTHEIKNGKKHGSDGSRSLMLKIIYGLMIVLFIAGAVFSGSRAGIPLALLSGFLSYMIFMHKKNSQHFLLSAVVILVISVALLSFLNLTPVINRFISNNPFLDGRWAIFSNTWEGIKTFFPLGAGPGTFPEIYRIFQPIAQTGFVNHAHNDYLELIFETGLLGVFFIAYFMYRIIITWKRIKTVKVREFHYIKIATGIGILVMLLHSTLEFNMHDSTNVLFFAVLVSIFLTTNQKKSNRKSLHLKKPFKEPSTTRTLKSMNSTTTS